MPDLHLADLRTGYLELIDYVLMRGRKVSPRSEPTIEVPHVSFTVDPTAPTMPLAMNRRANPAIGAAEALQLVAGVQTPDLMVSISSTFSKFLDGGAFAGSYGVAARTQLPRAIARLRSDPDSRRALVTIWDPAYHGHADGLSDYPCTIGLQFMLREGALNLHVFMRSSDVWWGIAYDVFQFTQLQHSVARALGVSVGEYFHTSASLHIYERDVDRADELHDPGPIHDFWPTGVGVDHGSDWDGIALRARLLLAGRTPTDATETELWYRDTIAPHLEDGDA